VARTFSYTQAWVSEGGKECENFSKKAVFIVVTGKNQISLLLDTSSSQATMKKVWGRRSHTFPLHYTPSRINFDGSSTNVTLLTSRKILLFWKVFAKPCSFASLQILT